MGTELLLQVADTPEGIARALAKGGGQDRVRRLAAHVQEHLGPIEGVFAAGDHGGLPVHTFWVRPRPLDRNHHLVTCGMSAHCMTIPPGCPDSPRPRGTPAVTVAVGLNR